MYVEDVIKVEQNVLNNLTEQLQATRDADEQMLSGMSMRELEEQLQNLDCHKADFENAGEGSNPIIGLIFYWSTREQILNKMRGVCRGGATK